MTIKKLLLLSLISLSFGGYSYAQNQGDEVYEDSCLIITTPVLRLGSRDSNSNNEVSALQEFLIEKGIISGSATGFYGRLTVAGVRKYQTANGISPTGSVGSITRKVIQKETCSNEISSPQYTNPSYPSTVTPSSVPVLNFPLGGNPSLRAVKQEYDPLTGVYKTILLGERMNKVVKVVIKTDATSEEQQQSNFVLKAQNTIVVTTPQKYIGKFLKITVVSEDGFSETTGNLLVEEVNGQNSVQVKPSASYGTFSKEDNGIYYITIYGQNLDTVGKIVANWKVDGDEVIAQSRTYKSPGVISFTGKFLGEYNGNVSVALYDSLGNKTSVIIENIIFKPTPKLSFNLVQSIYDAGGYYTQAVLDYSIDNYAKQYELQLEPTEIARNGDGYSGNNISLVGLAAESYYNARVNPWAPGGAAYRFSGRNGKITITKPYEYKEGLTMKVILVDTSNGRTVSMEEIRITQ
ncbi:MAG: putative peptidoglycan binding domain [Candidatus Parcubacteria bacterium]|jgi:peptidoglycan hydrolase-like protein with peptidoglycan-binding domain